MPNKRELAQAEFAERLAAFRTELNELLDKHGAILDVTIEGDTHGIFDSYVDVAFKPLADGHIELITDCVPLFEKH